MPTETLTAARLRGLDHADGEVIDAKSGLIARADRTASSLSPPLPFRRCAPRLVTGRFPELSLADARIAVGRIRQQVRNGSDPQPNRRNSRHRPAAMTFNELADLYIERYAKRSKSSWARGSSVILRVDVRPLWGLRPAASIRRHDASRDCFRSSPSARRLGPTGLQSHPVEAILVGGR